MQVSVESTGDIERKLKVEVPADRLGQEVDKRLKSMRGNVRIDGFRPGKVPLSVVNERYGDAVFHDVVGDVLQETLYEAATQENLRIAGAPMDVVPDVMERGKDLVYTATLEVYPEFEIGAVETLEITRATAEIEEADIDNMVETLRKQQQKWEEVDRPSQKGDQVVVNFEGTIDGESFEGGSASDFAVEVGAGRMLPEFEEALVNISKDEEKTVDVTFPDDYQAEDLQGKVAQFKITAKSVSEPVLPEVDEDFIKTFGVEDGTMESFRTEVKKNMQRELDQTITARIKEAVMDGLYDLHDIAAPKALVQDEIGHIRNEMAQNSGTDMSKLPDDLFIEQATRRVKLGLIVGEIISANNIKKDPEQVDDMLKRLSASYEDPQAIIDYYHSNPQAMQTIEAAVMEEMIVDWVVEKAKVTDEKMDFDTIINRKKAA
jgi:trigger factor